MKRIALFLLPFLLITQTLLAQSFTMEQIGKFSFPSELVSSPVGEQIAWAMYEQGKRNVYFAEAPDFKPLRLTQFNEDDGQEITSLKFSPDGNWLVFVRGGDHGGYQYSGTVNPDNLPNPPKVEIWKINLNSKKAEVITEGEDISLGFPDQLVFLKSGKAWATKLSGTEKPTQLFQTQGNVNSVSYSPDGKKLAFTVNRGGHQLLGIYEDQDTPIRWIAPSFHRYLKPTWSPDGNQIAFVKIE